ncbi:Integrase, catalytic core [Gossypium australe]|uniref:Integrase, catalytic core n=1 Tax=Gossypium australe TaxID=47621 RepID=A0A5B6W015_9ROSI|nr:Integrase, catalytic core [Gossypium australe]
MTDLRAMFARLSLVDDGGLLAELKMKPTLANEIKAKTPLDVEDDKTKEFGFNDDEILRYCEPNDKELKQTILWKTYASPYAMYLEGNKVYRDVKKLY